MTEAVLALDVGATKTSVGRVRRGRVSGLKRYPTSALFGPRHDVAKLLAAVRLAWRPNVRAVAVGFAGPVADGVVAAAPNFLPAVAPRRLPLRRLLQEAFDVPAVVANDGECFALGEATFGGGRGYRRVVGVTLGTGVGGGIVIDGRIYQGAHRLAGEFGHLPLPAASLPCGCGEVGHIEAVLSGPGLARLYALATGHAAASEAVVRAARRGDPAARHVLRQIEETLVHLILTILVTWDPDVVVVGGGLVSIPKLLMTARRRVRERAPFPALRRVPIVPSLLHDHATLLGAAALASSELTVPSSPARLLVRLFRRGRRVRGGSDGTQRVYERGLTRRPPTITSK